MTRKGMKKIKKEQFYFSYDELFVCWVAGINLPELSN